MQSQSYVAGSGMSGCLYNDLAECDTWDDAVEYLANLFELGRKRKAELKRDGYLSLNPTRDGAEYCEIVPAID